jgi:hypothetical protein
MHQLLQKLLHDHLLPALVACYSNSTVHSVRVVVAESSSSTVQVLAR